MRVGGKKNLKSEVGSFGLSLGVGGKELEKLMSEIGWFGLSVREKDAHNLRRARDHRLLYLST